jgi:hypothetical protein
MLRYSRLITVMTVLAAACTACTGGTVSGSSTITKAQAVARIEQLVNETTDIIRPKPTLEPFRPSLNDRSCLNLTDGGSKDQIVIYRAYYLRGIPADQIHDVAAEVKAYWQQQGHHIESESSNGLNIYGRSSPDDFTITLGWSEGGVLTLEATSTCIWPDGTPPP